MVAFDERKNHLARRLFEVGAVQFEPMQGFRLNAHDTHPEAPRSPFYIDGLGPFLSFPRLLNDAADLVIAAGRAFFGESDRISDVPLGSTPLAVSVMLKTYIPMISPYRDAAGGIAGQWKLGQRVVVIESVRSTGSSLGTVIDLYEAQGLAVVGTVVLIDRGSPEDAPVAGRPFRAVYHWSWLLDLYQRITVITDELRRRCVEYPAALSAHVRNCPGCK